MNIPWQNYLCGSALQVPQKDPEKKQVIPGHASEILSCGGSFLPKIRTTITPHLVHLPEPVRGCYHVKEDGSVDHIAPDPDPLHDEVYYTDEEIAFFENKFLHGKN